MIVLDYFNRKVISGIEKYLKYKEAIILYGARQVGKTTIMKMLISKLKDQRTPSEAIFYIDLEDLDLLNICENGAESIIKYIEARTSYSKKIYIFIDEIQYAKNAASLIKLMVDNHSDRFKLIVSGSSVLDIKSKIKQSLAGRIFTFEIYGLDFDEYLWFRRKKINLDMVDDVKTEKELKGLFEEFIYFGSYPGAALITEIDVKKNYLKELIQTYIRKDIRDIGRIRNILKFNNFIRVLADQAGNLLNVDNLASDIGIARETVYDYLTLLEGTYVLRRLNPFFKNLKSELTKMPKVYFEDNGILNYLRYNEIVEKVTGELFKNAIYTELRKLVGLENMKYWRTQSKREIDFIVEKGSVIYAFEVKKMYSGQSTRNLEYFQRNYPGSKVFLISLEKRNNVNLTRKGIPVIYPWQIHRVLEKGA